MQFKVPQFIDVESKILGDLTFKQAIYIGGGAGLSFVMYKFLHIILALPLILAIGSFSLALAFYPKQKLGKPFIELTESAFKYATKAKLYTWKRIPKKAKQEEEEIKLPPTLRIPKVSSGGLSNISKNIETRQIDQ